MNYETFSGRNQEEKLGSRDAISKGEIERLSFLPYGISTDYASLSWTFRCLDSTMLDHVGHESEPRSGTRPCSSSLELNVVSKSQRRRLCRLFSENPQKDFLPQKVPPNSRLLPACWRPNDDAQQATKTYPYGASHFAGCGNAGFYSRQTRFPARQCGLPARFIPPLSIADQRRL